jgi:hypothetical protein
VVAAILVILLAGPSFDAVMKNPAAVQVVDLPFPILTGWTLSGGWISHGAPEFPAADLQKHATYGCREHGIGVFVGAMASEGMARNSSGYGPPSGALMFGSRRCR